MEKHHRIWYINNNDMPFCLWVGTMNRNLMSEPVVTMLERKNENE